MDYTFHVDSPLGGITLASDGEALTGLWFDGQKSFADTLDAEHCEKALPIFDETAKWLDLYFAGIAPDYEKSFQRCGVKDYTIRIKDGMPHAWPVFTFLKEGRDGEREIIDDITHFYAERGASV